MSRPPIPRLVAATDDARLGRADFLERLAALLAGGCPAVWLRARRMPAGPFLELARRAGEACRSAGAELWVGDRADVARLAGADGVQLPERGLPVAGAREIVGPDVRIGRSVHGVGAAVAAAGDGADHVVAGTIYASGSHPAATPSGPGRLTEIRDALDEAGTPVPIVAIGGVTPARVGAVLEAGADGVAAIGALWDADEPAAAATAFLAALG